MNVLLLNAWDSSGGAAKATCRLLKGLQDSGFDATMLVKDKSGSDPSILGPTTLNKILSLLRPRLEGRLVRRYNHWNGFTFSPAIFPDRLIHQANKLGTDLIHFHWMGDGFLRIETLPRFNKPIVWTLHDSWPFTGGCHIPFDCLRYRESCGKCPTLGSNRDIDLSRKIWQRKLNAWKSVNLTIVAPSNWMADCARSSSLFKDIRIEVIPNGIDLNRYRPVDKVVAREALALPQEKKLILFGAKSATQDRNKGFHLLVQALKELTDSTSHNDIELLLFGAAKSEPLPDLGFRIHSLGWLNDDISLALLYSAADVFVFPSQQESLGYTAMEAMACGTPCVAFRQGGVPDMIDHKLNGYLARPFEPADIAQGIAWVLGDKHRWAELSLSARQKVEHEFALEKVTEQHIALYRELCDHA